MNSGYMTNWRLKVASRITQYKHTDYLSPFLDATDVLCNYKETIYTFTIKPGPWV